MPIRLRQPSCASAIAVAAAMTADVSGARVELDGDVGAGHRAADDLALVAAAGATVSTARAERTGTSSSTS